MNSTKTLSDRNRYSSIPFFKFTLKNNWQQFALYLIIMLLVIILPCVMMINEYLSDREIYNWESVISNTTVSCGLFGVFASLAAAVFSGMSAVSYVNSKQMVGCYHSFALRREGLFLVETSVRAIYYLVAYLPCAIAAWILININLPMTAYYNIVYLKHIAAAILCYLLLYSVILFAGGLTGTAPVRLIMALLILYLPLALYALLLVCAYIGIPRLNEGYYLSDSVMRVICSTYRIGEAVARIDSNLYPEHFAYIFWAIPEIAVYYSSALLLHKHRKSESSGTTIIWKPVFVVTKYITIFTAALLGIAIFGSGLFSGMEGSPAWIIFGLIFGLVISSMVVNAILYRSSKAIFKGLRGLAAVAAAAVIVMLILPLDVFDLSHKIYNASNTKSLSIDGIVFENTEDFEPLVAQMRNEHISEEDLSPSDYYETRYVYLWNENDTREELIEEFQYTIYSSQEEADAAWNSEDDYLKENYDFHYDSGTYVDIIQKPKFGIPLAKRIYIQQSGELWNTIVRSEEYKASVDETAAIAADNVYNLHIQFGNYSEYIDFTPYENEVIARETAPQAATNNEYGTKYDPDDVQDILAEFLPYCLYNADSRDNGVIVGHIEVSVKVPMSSVEVVQYRNKVYPIYADNLEVLNGVCRILNTMYNNVKDYVPYPTFESADEYMDHFVENTVKAVAIIDSETGEIRSLPVEQFHEIAPSTAYLRQRGHSSVSDFMNVFDSRYWLAASFRAPTYDQDETYHYTRTLYLREGAITDAELAEYFAKAE